MASIKYLIAGDPYLSMVFAIKAENIMYSRFYNKFLDLWARFSLLQFSDAFYRDDAIHTINGVDVYGNSVITLFSDDSVGYKYTKEFCTMMGADYNYMLSHVDDVEAYTFSLDAYHQRIDYRKEENIRDAMGNIKDLLETYEINTINLSFVLDTEYDTTATSSMDLFDIRANCTPHINYNTGAYLTNIPTLIPIIEYRGLPSSTEEAGEVVVVSDDNLSIVMATFLKFTDHFDDTFATITIDIEVLDDRNVVRYDENGVEYTDVYHQYRYNLSFSFGSTIDDEGVVTNLINWGTLIDSAFISSFSSQYSASVEYYNAHRVCDDALGGREQCYLDSEPSASLIVYSAIASHFGVFSSLDEIFYVPNPELYEFANIYDFNNSYIRVSKLGSVQIKVLVNIIFTSVKISYVSLKDGWLGGSFFGQFLEALFVFVVVVVSLYFLGYYIIAGIIILYVATNYGGMSRSGKKLAGYGITILSLAGIAYGVYEIYTMAYESAIETEVASMIADGASEEAAVVAASSNVGAIEVVSALSAGNYIKILLDVYTAFKIFSPETSSPTSSDASAVHEENIAIYNSKTAYDFYDDVYNIY